MRIALLLTALLAGAVPALAVASAATELRSSLFRDADAALAAANAADAGILAPESYDDGMRDYERADEIFEDSGDIDDIKRHLAESTAAFERAATHAAVAAETFATAIEARNDAGNASAAEYAPDLWEEAEEDFDDAAHRLEDGRERSAGRLAEDAEAKYREAELAAIKTNYLAETRGLLEKADDERAERYAPQTFKKAQQLLATAENELNRNRYDTDRPRNLAQRAEHEARHAIFLSGLTETLRDRDTTLETILLDWEGSIRRIADQLDAVVYFDNGQQAASDMIVSRINDMQRLNARLAQDLGDQKQQVRALREQLAGEGEALAEANRVIEQQQRMRDRFAQVGELFASSEAVVLRQGNDVIIRMVGLNFDVGASHIKPEHYVMLNKLAEAVAAFPRSRLVIEGHTDAFGSDASNLALSRARSRSVEQYLVASTSLDAGRISAVGYGETQPVANNETSEGRRKNRRIDAIIIAGE